MTGQTKSTPVINLENTYGVVLSVHGHQLEVKYQKSVEQSGNYSHLHDGRQTIEGREKHFLQDNVEEKKKVEQLFNLLKKCYSRSQLDEICLKCNLDALNNTPQGCANNTLINEIVREVKDKKIKIDEVLEAVLEIVSNGNHQNRRDCVEQQ